MAFYYLETSALVKLYVREPGTDRMLSLASRSNLNRLAILSLSQVELWSAIRRRQKNGEISQIVATQLLETFKRHSETKFITQIVSDSLLDMAMMLVDRYWLRAYDAIQLAGYLALKNSAGSDVPFFVCSDKALLSAAIQEGVPIVDPCL